MWLRRDEITEGKEVEERVLLGEDGSEKVSLRRSHRSKSRVYKGASYVDKQRKSKR